jgi:hypothetical protein
METVLPILKFRYEFGEENAIHVCPIQTSTIFTTRGVYIASYRANLIFVRMGPQQYIAYTKPKWDFIGFLKIVHFEVNP